MGRWGVSLSSGSWLSLFARPLFETQAPSKNVSPSKTVPAVVRSGVPRKPSECSSFVAGVSFKLEDVVPSFARQTDSKVAIPGPGYHSWKEILEEALGSVAACVTY